MERNVLKALIPFSGGFDSMALAEYVESLEIYEEIHLLYFNHGNRNYKAEKQAVESYLKECNNPYFKFVEKELPLFSSTEGDVYVPSRNFIFLSHATSYAEKYGIRDIFFGTVEGFDYYYPDTSPVFVQKMNEVLGVLTAGRIEIKAPFIRYDKYSIAHVLKDCGVSLERINFIWENAVTCNVTESISNCGECESCIQYEKFKSYFQNYCK